MEMELQIERVGLGDNTHYSVQPDEAFGPHGQIWA